MASSSSSSSSSSAAAAASLFEPSPRCHELRETLRAFMREHIYPAEAAYAAHVTSDRRWQPLPFIDALKAKAREAGLWNLFLPKESDPRGEYGAGLSNLEYAMLAEEMGRVLWCSEVFNCSAPDTGNMEVLVRYGTDDQRRRWLTPLLAGEIRSVFGMTEPDVASSDATNIQSTIRREGNDYVINGRKWWSSGAMDPRCKIMIFMGKSDPTAPTHRQQSMILVPMDTPGLRIVRHLSVFGYDDAPHGHAEIELTNVRVPASNMLLGEGRGFEIAQGRLGPGRIHHCMRCIGAAERAIDLAKRRATQRVAFGSALIGHGVVAQSISESRCEIEQARLLCLKAAAVMDASGNKVARGLISMIKVVAPRMALNVVDRAIQIHGGCGVSQDTVLAGYWAQLRTLRFADGPDEVHHRLIARLEMAKL